MNHASFYRCICLAGPQARLLAGAVWILCLGPDPGRSSEPTWDVATLKVQILLDQMHFPPGVLDGVPGRLTRAMMKERFPDHKPKAVYELADRLVSAPLKTCRIGDQDFQWMERSDTEEPENGRRVYRTAVEALAERFHTSERALARFNPLVDLEELEPETEVHVPNVSPFEIDRFESGSFGEDGAGQRAVLVRQKERLLEVRDAGTNKVVACFPCLDGGDTLRHTGRWTVLTVVAFPSFTFVPDNRETDRTGAVLIPPGPNNPVGVCWTGLANPAGARTSIGIHGTSEPGRITRAEGASKGCVRLANWDVARLAHLIERGSRVVWSP